MTDLVTAKPKATSARQSHPAARWLPLVAAFLLAGAIAANVFAHVTPSWLKTTAYPTLLNSDGVAMTRVNANVLTRVGPSEICYFITNATAPIRARHYCLALSAENGACDLAQSKPALAQAKLDYDSDEATFLRLVCGDLGRATIVLHVGAIVAAGVAFVAVLLSCCLRGRVGRVLRIVTVAASLVSGALALTTYIVWLTKLSTGDMHHGKSAVLTASSVFLLAGAALASSAGLEIFSPLPPPIQGKDSDEASAIAA